MFFCLALFVQPCGLRIYTSQVVVQFLRKSSQLIQRSAMPLFVCVCVCLCFSTAIQVSVDVRCPGERTFFSQCCTVHPSQLLITCCLFNHTHRSIVQQTSDHTSRLPWQLLSILFFHIWLLPCLSAFSSLRDS